MNVFSVFFYLYVKFFDEVGIFKVGEIIVSLGVKWKKIGEMYF